MNLHPLPLQVHTLLRELFAPPRLVAHLTLVHDVACTLTAQLDASWPDLAYDREAVRLGAAVHDIGKVVHVEELSQPGHAHEAAGEERLRAHGFPDEIARFARTHNSWDEDSPPRAEDLLVALADTWWRGKRDTRLEAAVCQWIVEAVRAPEWQVFANLDDISTAIAAHADERLAWQQRSTVLHVS
jgi:putative nucleotidyltransferase with HDIG domain